MDKKKKSIWKKTPSPLLAWLILFAGTFLAIFLIGSITGNIHTWQEWRRALLFTIFAGATVATVVVGLWFFIRWLFCWRNFKRFLFGLACFATLIALFYAEEDWRGKHDWGKFKRQWEAKGEKFDWQSIVPPPVPDDQNFAFSPVWIAEERYNFQKAPKSAEAWYGGRIYSAEVSKIFPLLLVTTSAVVGTNAWNYGAMTPDSSGNWQTAQLFNLKPWQTYYRDLEKTNPAAEIPVTPQPQSPAADVLLALSKFDPVIEQLREDSARPDSRFPIGYDDKDKASILLPHLAAVKRYSLVLRLRAIAELQNDQNDKALADVKLSLRLAEAIRSEPFLISHLVRIAVIEITLQPIYEGLAQNKWSDGQLADLDSELAKLDFLADYGTAMRGERALAIQNVESIRHSHNRLRVLTNMSGDWDNTSPDGLMAVLLSFGPSGWLDQNELRISRFHSQWYLPAVNVPDRVVFPAKVRGAESALNSEFKHRSPENCLESMFLPALGAAMKRFAYAQESIDLARVAIALERYRLAHGEFPESLDALAPQFMEKIPHDIIGGKPLHYRRTDDGQFVLYSVGWNETDDGGVAVLNKGNSPSVDISQGDWVWRYPAK